MHADITIKEYYAEFINQMNKKWHKENLDYEAKREFMNDLFQKVLEHKDGVIKHFGINPEDNDFDKQVLEYNFEKAKTIARNEIRQGDKVAIIVFMKYINNIKKEYASKLQAKIYERYKDISFADYKNILVKYYRYGVHKCLLQGYAYSVTGGLGYLSINRWKVVGNKEMIDFDATNKARKELIAKGLKPYDKEEAEIARMRGVKYDGVPYVVRTKTDYKYKIELTGNNKFSTYSALFKPLNSVPARMRDKNQQQIADSVKSEEEIYNLPCDVNYKMDILLKYDKMAYLNFVRNVNQVKTELSTVNSGLRKRYDDSAI